MPAKAYGGARSKVLNTEVFFKFFFFGLGRALLATNVFLFALLSWLVQFWAGAGIWIWIWIMGFLLRCYVKRSPLGPPFCRRRRRRRSLSCLFYFIHPPPHHHLYMRAWAGM